MVHATATALPIAFDSPRLLVALDALRDEPAQYDRLDFGLVVMDLAGTVLFYNSTEAAYAGLSPERVVSLNFFTDVAPCTNNYLVSGRFDEESDLDETIDYVFTIKMKPTRVQLRMLKDEHAKSQYLAVKRC